MSLELDSFEIDKAEFGQRLAQARRSGTPAWLWPEIPVDHWIEATSCVSKAATSVLAGDRGVLRPIDPMAISLACYTSGMGPLLGWWVETGLLDAAPELCELLALHLDQGRARTRSAEALSRAIIGALVHSDVPVVVLKGAHTAHCYFTEAATRPASDIDLLVPADCAAKAEVALAKVGLECVTRNPRETTWMMRGTRREPRSLWLAHGDDAPMIDLHRSLDFCASAGAPIVRFDSVDPFGAARPWPLDAAAGVLGQPLLLLHLAVHASGGLHSLTLLRTVEIVFVIREDIANGRLSWDDFLALGARVRGLGGAYPALSMAEKLAPGTVPSSVLEICAELAPARARAIVARLEPATAQRVDRVSVAEHFMWVSGFSGWVRQLRADLLPQSGSGRSFRSIYEARFQSLVRRRISR